MPTEESHNSVSKRFIKPQHRYFRYPIYTERMHSKYWKYTVFDRPSDLKKERLKEIAQDEGYRSQRSAVRAARSKIKEIVNEDIVEPKSR